MNIARGNRLLSWMGLKMADGFQYKYPPKGENNYGYVEIPVEGIEEIAEGRFRIVPACMLKVRGPCRILVQPNPEFNAYGPTQGSYYLESGGEEVVPSFIIFSADLGDAEEFEYAVRLYLVES